MATWMEKDVLIEGISSVLGPASWTHAIDDPDCIALAQQQGRLYRMSPKKSIIKRNGFYKVQKSRFRKISTCRLTCIKSDELDIWFEFIAFFFLIILFFISGIHPITVRIIRRIY